MADSGTYDDATLQRRYAMAQALMQHQTPIKHWAEGLGNLAESALGGYQLSKLDNERKTERDQGKADLYASLGLPAPAGATAAPEGGFQKLAALLSGGGASAPAPPVAAPASAAPPPAGLPSDQASYPASAPPPDAGTTFRPGITAPLPGVAGSPAAGPIAPLAAPLDIRPSRGIRNNNPLNIEAGGFTQGQPGFAGSDGRFARFETSDQGVAAANKLLDTYQSKYGLNTPAGIIGRWAPQGENNSAAYAASVAKDLGIGPNDPITPEMRPALIAAMSKYENGPAAAIPRVATALNAPPRSPDAALPPGATPAQGALPTAAQAAGTPPGLLSSVPTETKAQIAQMLTSKNPTVKALGTALFQQAAKPPEYGFQTLPDGTIVRTDPRKGTVEPTYQAPTKQTFGVIGEEDGKKTYGFIDTAKNKVTPLEPAKPGDERPTVTGPDGKEIVIPKGVDVPTFKKEVSRASADAATGKMTEVQGNAQQFANRMEAAQASITPELEKQALGLSGAAQQVAGKIPVVGSALQTEAYQKYNQGKSQFITAVLRKESGAAISKEEFNRYDKEFFPQPGDKPETIAQKAQERKVAVDAMKRVAGPSYKSPDLAKPPEADGWTDMGGGIRIREKK